MLDQLYRRKVVKAVRRRLLMVLAAMVVAGGSPALSQDVDQPIAAISGPVTQLSVRVAPGAPLQLDSGAGPSWWTYWVPVVGPVISGLLAYFGIRLSLAHAERNAVRNIETLQKTSEAAIWQKANETELKDLLAKLDGFYGPFMQMSQTNYLMAADVRSRQPEDYRLLIKVFDRHWLESLSPGDRKIVEEVCQNAAKLHAFIAEKAGIVEDKILPYLARASAHFRILHLEHRA